VSEVANPDLTGKRQLSESTSCSSGVVVMSLSLLWIDHWLLSLIVVPNHWLSFFFLFFDT